LESVFEFEYDSTGGGVGLGCQPRSSKVLRLLKPKIMGIMANIQDQTPELTDDQ
jgi:hypothetical protein